MLMENNSIIFPDKIEMTLRDRGPGIEDIELAMRAGYTTAPDNIRPCFWWEWTSEYEEVCRRS